jgi:hypothetical protein
MKYTVLLMLSCVWITAVDAMRTRPIAQASEILAAESSSEEEEILVPGTPENIIPSDDEPTPGERKKIRSPGPDTCPAKKPRSKKD